MAGDRILRFLFVFCISIANPGWSTPSADDHASLVSDLLSRYNKTTRPSRDQSKSTEIAIYMFFILIHQLDMRRQILVSNGWIIGTWIDDFLQWDPEQYGGIQDIDLPRSLLWTPDITAYNTANENREFGNGRELIHVTYDGRIMWSPDFNFETSCQVDITHFPFDTQRCQLQVCTWSTTNWTSKLFSNQSGPDLKYMLSNGEFDIQPSPVIKYDREINMLSFGIVLRRKVTYYVLGLLLPVCMLSMLCVMSFLLPAESGEKMTMSMTTWLSFTVYLGVIDSSMPKTSENISLIVVYITSLLAVSVVSVLGNTIVLILNHRKKPPSLSTTSLPVGGAKCECEKLKEVFTSAYLVLRETKDSYHDLPKVGAPDLSQAVPDTPTRQNVLTQEPTASLNRKLFILITMLLVLISAITILLFIYVE